jgi:uncharacterized protein (UPF0218 family)
LYKLPTTLRSKLREPLGKIISETDLSGNLDKATKCIVVGDESAITLHKFKYNIKLAIVDFQTQRRNDAKLKEEVQKIGTKVLRVINPAGTITDALWTAIDLGLKSPESVRIEVDGEEDLAFIPCMLLAPDDAIVIYGYPGRGLVLAEVNPKNRKEASDALESMVKEEE